MKILIASITLLFLSMACLSQGIKPASVGKSVVYFVRTSGVGFAINFTYFDSAKVIGKFNGEGYFRYECEPGVHLLWARSENRDFVNADLEAGKIYFIEAQPKMGAFKAAVRILPVIPDDEKTMKRILKLINKKSAEYFPAEELETETNKSKDVIQRGLEKYKEEKAKGKENERLDKTMYYKGQ